MIVEESKVFNVGTIQYVITKQYLCGKVRDTVKISRCYPVEDGRERGYHYEYEYKDVLLCHLDYDNDLKLERQLQNQFGIYV